MFVWAKFEKIKQCFVSAASNNLSKTKGGKKNHAMIIIMSRVPVRECCT